MGKKQKNPTIMQSGALPDYVQNPLDWANMQGWKSFPLVPGKKIPCEPDPFGTATNDPEKIKEWFPRYPECGFGIVTGASNSTTVLDIDIKNGVNGLENFSALGITIPKTGIVRTPSGGFHVYFYTGSLQIPCSVGKVAPGVDVRGYGGYAVGPGTRHQNGTYHWIMDSLAPIHRMAEMPPRLIELCMKAKSTTQYDPGSHSSEVRYQLMDPIPKGQRNTTMASRIGYMLKYRDPDRVYKAATYINQHCCVPPLHEVELWKIFRSILRKELRSRG
jgi:hypothetical protein